MQDGNTPLMHAVIRDHVDCARLLIDGGADKEAEETAVRAMCIYVLCEVECGRCLGSYNECACMNFRVRSSVSHRIDALWSCQGS